MEPLKPGPSKLAEALVGIFIPAPCRENVLGDLYERYKNPSQYALDAVRTIPFVIASRIHRTADSQIVLLQALALYLAYVAAAWYLDAKYSQATRD